MSDAKPTHYVHCNSGGAADDTAASRKSGNHPTAPDAASAPQLPMPTVIATLTLTTEQANYLSDLRRRETNFDPSVVIGGPRQRTP